MLTWDNETFNPKGRQNLHVHTYWGRMGRMPTDDSCLDRVRGLSTSSDERGAME